jgi:hypothetical protein
VSSPGGAPPINRIPWGLLGFLGIKNGGRNPSALADFVQPGWDLGELYLQTNSEFFSTAGAVNALGYNVGFSSALAEVTWVHGYSVVTATLGAGQALNGCIMVADQNGITGVAYGPIRDPGAVGNRLLLALERPVILSPGQQIGFYISSIAAGPINYTTQIRVSRLPT